MVTQKDGHITPTRVVIRSKQYFKGEILAEVYQSIKDPVNIEDLLKSLDDEQMIERILLTNVPVDKGNVDKIIQFFQDAKSKLV